MKKILLQLDTDPHPSSFDTIAAYDAGVDQVLLHGGITPDTVKDLVYGAIFTRGGEQLKNTAVFVGGRDVPLGEEVLARVQGTFFGNFRVSVMLDSNGSNTTACTAVARITRAVDVKGKKVVVLAGTGPVGMRAAGLLAQEGAEVTITSRNPQRAELSARRINERFGVRVTPAVVADRSALGDVVSGAAVCFATGGPKVELLPEEVWREMPGLELVADVNAVPPLGVGGIEMTDSLKERHGKLCLGALGIGNYKMKVHWACVAALFERNDLVLEAEKVYEIARSVVEQIDAAKGRAG